MKKIISFIIAALMLISVPASAATKNTKKENTKSKAKIEKKVDIKLTSKASVIDGKNGYTLTALVPRRGSAITFKWTVKEEGSDVTNELKSNKPSFKGNSGYYNVSANFVPETDKKYTITFTAAMTAGKSSTVFIGKGSIDINGVPVANKLQSTYAFSTNNLLSFIQPLTEIALPVTLKAVKINDLGYDNVKTTIACTTPTGGVINLNTKDSSNNIVDAALKGYYGNETGFALAKDYNATTDFTAKFSIAGTYTIKFALVNLADNTEITSKTITVNVGVQPGAIKKLSVIKLALTPASNTADLYNLSVTKILVEYDNGQTEVVLNPAFLAGTFIFSDFNKEGYVMTFNLSYDSFIQPITLTRTQILSLL